MDKNLYNKTLEEEKNLLSMPIEKIDVEMMSSKEKSKKILELQEEIQNLKLKLSVTERVNKRYIQGLIYSKAEITNALLSNPILTLPSGTKIEFNSLSEEQLEYLESIAISQKKM